MLRHDPPPPPTDRILFSSETATIGAFRCRPEHPQFTDSGPIEGQLVVFPRTSVEIEHEGSRPFVADPAVATIYNLGQRYRRGLVDPSGDRCEWFAVAPAVAFELSQRFDPAVEERPAEPYRFEFAPVSSDLYLRQRRLVERLLDGEVDPLAVDEAVMAIVDATLDAAYRARGARRRPTSAANRAAVGAEARELAERAAALLAADLDAPLPLAALALQLGVSAPHLCRTFRRARGTTLHAHRTELRLRSALEALREGDRGLTEVALAYGFSSHSHFTNAFRRRFGLVPSRAWAA